MPQFINNIICRIKGHMWLEWTHPRIRDCIRCGVRRKEGAQLSEDMRKYVRKQRNLQRSGRGVRVNDIE